MVDAVLAQPGEADGGIRKLLRQPGDRDDPRAQCDARMLLGAHREELTMAALAPAIDERRPEPMDNVSRLDADTAWAAFMRRDRAWDGRVIGAVKTTGIYCKPSCPARRPKREHVEFFASAEEARAAGYRSCLRCKPDEVGRDREAVAAAVKLIETGRRGAEPRASWPRRSAMRRTISSASSSATSACRRRNMPVRLRNRRAEGALEQNGRVTDAIYDAGYSGPSRFYSDAKERLGMTPSAWRDGGRGETIRWTPCRQPARARC